MATRKKAATGEQTLAGAVAELGAFANQMTAEINALEQADDGIVELGKFAREVKANMGNQQALVEASIAAQNRGEQYVAVAQQFGYTLPYNRERMIDEVRHYMGESARTMLEAGARLAMIRTQATHGEWLETCVALKLEDRTAQRMIKSAKLFGANATTSSHFKNFGASKLFEMLVLDDEDVGVLVAGGGLEHVGTLDDIATMTVSELRAALREMREENRAKDNLLTEKSGVITKLQAKKALLPPPSPNEELKALRREMSDVTAHVEANIRGVLRDGIQKLRDGGEVTEENADAFIAGLLGQMHNAIAETAALFGMALPQAQLEPAWALEEISNQHA